MSTQRSLCRQEVYVCVHKNLHDLRRLRTQKELLLSLAVAAFDDIVLDEEFSHDYSLPLHTTK